MISFLCIGKGRVSETWRNNNLWNWFIIEIKFWYFSATIASNTFIFLKLASAVLEAVENNTLSIEPVGLQPIRFVKASAVECGGPK